MKREQLTITLRDDILKRIDERIDGITIRNRSHAIEVFLSKYLSVGKVRKALILAGGKGTRMRPFTYEIPKPMIPVQGKPLIQHIISLNRKHGITDITISVGYLGDRIKEYFGNGSRLGMNINYVEETEPLGTAGCLNLVRAELNEPFLMFNGDVLSDIDLSDFISFHDENKSIATIALTPVDDPSRFGVARLKGNKIKEFVEKPKKGKEPSKLINAGVYLLEPEVFKYVPEGFAMMEKDVFPKLAKEGKLTGYSFTGQWFDTGTVEAYENVIKNWKAIK
ncbi:MAG: nucleotidyltransferase family protein [Candidatus Altiarchaeota archaeon]